MPEPHRELLLAELTSVLGGLAGIRHFDGPYLPFSPPLCQRGYEEPTTIARLPAFQLDAVSGSEFARPGDHETSEGFGESAGVGFRDHFRVGIWGYVQATPGISASTWIERLWWDLVLTLKANRTLGERANDIALIGQRRLGVHASQPGVAWFEQEIDIVVDPVPISVEG